MSISERELLAESNVLTAGIEAALRRAFEEHPDFYDIFLAALEGRVARNDYEELAPVCDDAITVD